MMASGVSLNAASIRTIRRAPGTRPRPEVPSHRSWQRCIRLVREEGIVSTGVALVPAKIEGKSCGDTLNQAIRP